MSYFKQKEFVDYLSKRGRNPKSYSSSVNAVFNRMLTKLGLSNPCVNGNLICTKKDLIDIVNILTRLMWYAHTTNNMSVKNKFGVTDKVLVNYTYALTAYEKYIESILCNSSRDKNQWSSQWKPSFDSTIREIMGSLRVDGNDSLFKLFNTGSPSSLIGGNEVSSFLKYVLPYCYFFDPNDAKDQHEQILKDIQNRKPVPARNSTSHIAGSCYGIRVKSDKNGNAPVVALIQDKTGYSVSKGEDSLFTNYKISHIWQNAWHPLYFTNLWNIVLVPAWANDILDKTKTQDIRTKHIIDTFREICIVHYNMRSSNFIFSKYSSQNYPNAIKNPITIPNNNKIQGTYEIKVIRPKNNVTINKSTIGSLLGNIDVVKITI